MPYNVIYADPPWSYKKSNAGRGGNSSASKKYQTMTNEDICCLPIADLTEKNAVLFVWATVPLMPEAFAVMGSWGFSYKTMLTWRKVMSLGMGYWFRGQCEHLLLGVKGKVKPFYMQVPNFYQCKAGRHSEKPHYFRELIATATDKVFQEPRRLELFARSKHNLFGDDVFKGWEVFGNEVKNSIEIAQQ
jgi:N6-adenosine-specific RNA methylase IME4